MAMGVPCVGTRAAGLEEAIVEGVTGGLCEPGDAKDLALVLERLLDDPAALDRMGATARDHVRRTFDAARNFELLFQLFEGTCDAAPRGMPR
jgi:glycosyltransferase involved in cell wall biosynthesis